MQAIREEKEGKRNKIRSYKDDKDTHKSVLMKTKEKGEGEEDGQALSLVMQVFSLLSVKLSMKMSAGKVVLW